MRLGMVGRMYAELIGAAHDKREAASALVRDKGLQVVSGSVGSGNWKDSELFDELLRLREELGIELEGGWAYDFVSADSDTATRKLEELAEFIENCCKRLGVTIIGTCAATDRWLKDPPLQEALRRITDRLTPAARLCERAGVRLAIENHADYRAQEIASIIQNVNSPGLRARLDTGNPFWTYEDPLDAAEALAPYVITTHVKDIRILKYGKNEGAVLGQGHVDLPRIVGILAQRSPDPEKLALIAEVEGIPEGDRVSAYDASLEYLRTTFAACLDKEIAK